MAPLPVHHVVVALNRTGSSRAFREQVSQSGATTKEELFKALYRKVNGDDLAKALWYWGKQETRNSWPQCDMDEAREQMAEMVKELGCEVTVDGSPVEKKAESLGASPENLGGDLDENPGASVAEFEKPEPDPAA